MSSGVITAQPEYYAMLAFKYGALGNLLPATVGTTTYNCTAYACISGGSTYITLINKDTNNLSFVVKLSQNASGIKIARLTAPSITSTTGITFAGSAVNTDGSYKTYVTEQYTVNQNSFTINIPAGSAAVVTVQ